MPLPDRTSRNENPFGAPPFRPDAPAPPDWGPGVDAGVLSLVTALMPLLPSGWCPGWCPVRYPG
ncbi:hypothetical protein ACFFX0_28850 [Citricoccus parietis]|uniref:Uncharacterized protein n=1 Tax=Citricoccus parietis TaxID=592307 RepID=A0ABV5G5U4_9MICC